MRLPASWSTWALGAGMLVAGALAASETTRVSDAQRALPEGVAARVGDMAITAEELDRAAEALARDRREGAQPGDRAHVLDRLVDEALLVQLALEQGLAHRDPRTRADLTAAALQLLAGEAELSEPSPAELEAFYATRRGELRGAPQVQVEQRFARGPGARERVMADDAGALDDPPLPLPAGWLSERDLRELFGGSLAAQVFSAEEGAWLLPRDFAGGVQRVRVVQRRSPAAPPLEEVRGEVLTLYRRERADDAVRAYLARAREETPIAQRSLPRAAPLGDRP